MTDMAKGLEKIYRGIMWLATPDAKRSIAVLADKTTLFTAVFAKRKHISTKVRLSLNYFKKKNRNGNHGSDNYNTLLWL